MGSYNGAEICDMVGLFLLNEINTTKLFKNGEFGIFRDDGLAVIQSKTPRNAELCEFSLNRTYHAFYYCF